jgi:hypothetical protein
VFSNSHLDHNLTTGFAGLGVAGSVLGIEVLGAVLGSEGPLPGVTGALTHFPALDTDQVETHWLNPNCGQKHN